MGLFSRRRPVDEVRAVSTVPWDIGAPTTRSVSQERALGLPAVYASARHIGDQISTLPLHAYRRVDDRREPMRNLPVLFQRLVDDGDIVDWSFALLASLALRGNAVGLITGRDGLGFPTSITWLSMADIRVDDTTARPEWFWRGRRIDRSEIVHVPWFKIPGRTLGLSPIEAYAAVVTNGLEAMTYASDWFAAGGVPPGKFKNSSQKIDQVEADAVKARLVAAIRSHMPIVYGADWDYDVISVPPGQAQFVESSKLTANQIAAIYGIAPEEAGGEAANSLTYSNEEMRQITRMSNLRPWIVRLERKFSSWVPRAQYVRFNIDASIRPDTRARYDVYRIAREIGLLSIDEIRAREDLPPLPGGQGTTYAPLAKGGQTEPVPALPTPSNGRKPANV